MAKSQTLSKGSSRLMTADEFFELDIPDARAELVRGEVVRMSFAGGEHSVVAARITARLQRFVEAHALGFVTTEAGFILAHQPDTVRGPDVSFVSFQRLGGQPLPRRFWPFAPDLAVEVISPSERPRQVRDKARDWFAGGTRRVWLVYPRTRNVYVLRSPTDVQILGPQATLSGDEILPGFSCTVAELFL